MGHPSLVKFQYLNKKLQVYDVSRNVLYHCKVCHLAKQKRLPFISTNKLSDNHFDLIHIDIWSLFFVPTTE